jgi:hypothetical protein
MIPKNLPKCFRKSLQNLLKRFSKMLAKRNMKIIVISLQKCLHVICLRKWLKQCYRQYRQYLQKRLQIASDNACENAYEKTSKNAYEDNCELF